MPRKPKAQDEHHEAPKAYTIVAADDSAEILLYDVIGKDWWTGEGTTAKQFAADIKPLKGKKLTVRINSPGGNVTDGTAIYNALKRHTGGVDVYIDGLAASMASVIAMAGETVTMSEGSLMMIHNPHSSVRGDEHDMRKAADVLSKHKASLLQAYTTKTGKDADEISSLMDEETWMTANEAYDLGFADAVTEEEPVMALWTSDELANAKCFNVPAQFQARVNSLSRKKEPEMAEEKPQGDAGTPTTPQAPARIAATVEQLAALAGADDQWIVAQLKAGATLDEAKDSLLAKLNADVQNARKHAEEVAKPKAEGIEPIQGAKKVGEQPAEQSQFGPSAKSFYIAEMRKAVQAGMAAEKASQHVFNLYPGLEDALAN